MRDDLYDLKVLKEKEVFNDLQGLLDLKGIKENPEKDDCLDLLDQLDLKVKVLIIQNSQKLRRLILNELNEIRDLNDHKVLHDNLDQREIKENPVKDDYLVPYDLLGLFDQNEKLEKDDLYDLLVLKEIKEIEPEMY